MKPIPVSPTNQIPRLSCPRHLPFSITRLCPAIATLFLCLPGARAQAPGTRAIVVSESPAPVPAAAPNDTFKNIVSGQESLDPILDDAGRVTFVASLTHTVGGQNGIYQSSPAGTVRLIVRTGMEETPGFSYSSITKMRASDSGHICFHDSSGFLSRILRWNPNGTIDHAATVSDLYLQEVPASARSLVEPEYFNPAEPTSVFKYFTPGWLMNDNGDLLVNAAMRTAFYRTIPESQTKSKEWSGLLALPRLGPQSFVFATGFAKDSGQGLDAAWKKLAWSNISEIAMSDRGWTGSLGYLDPGSSVEIPSGYVEYGTAWTDLARGSFTSLYPGTVARHRQSISDGAMLFNPTVDWNSGFSNLRSDDRGNITFRTSVRKANGSTEVRAFAMRSNAGGLFEPMPRGLPVPGHGSVEFDGWPLDSGRWAGDRIVQKVRLTGGLEAILSRFNSQTPEAIAVQNQAAPAGVTLHSLELPSVNGLGSVAFAAGLADSNGRAIFFKASGAPLKRIAGTGDSFLGSTLTDLGMVGEALNGRDQVLFHFTLNDGRTGLALADGTTAYQTWVTSYNLPADQAGPLQDPDGDGSLNAQEFEDGTDPTSDVALVRRLEITAGSGTVLAAPAKPSYPVGETVTVTATAPAGLVFHEWSGDASGNANPLTLVMDRTRRVSAVFLTPFEAWVRGFSLGQTGLGPYDDPDLDLVANIDEFEDQTNPADGNSFFPFLTLTTTGQGSVSAAPARVTYAVGTAVTVTATPAAGTEFLDWSGDATGIGNPLSVTMSQSKSIVANFGQDLAPAVEAEGYRFTTGGDVRWFPQTSNSLVGGDSLRSGAIAHNQETWVETVRNGPGTLKFLCTVSSQSGGDYLQCYLDGTLQFQISGSVSWAERILNIAGNGNHTIRWRYFKNASVTSGSDAAWLDNVQWVSDSPLASWAAAAGLTGANALPEAIPFKDGVANLLKYAFNMDGSKPDSRILVPGSGSQGLPAISREPGILRVEFLRRIGSGLVYTPMKSSSLTSGSWQPLTDTPAVTTINATWERVVYEEPVASASNPRCFGAVEVKIP